MTVEFWRSAERFYELWFFVLALLLLFLVVVLIFVFSYSRKENRKKAVLFIIGLIICIGGVSLNGHFKYRPYLTESRYSNPLIRDREPKLHMHHYYSEEEMVLYSNLNGREALQKMSLYDEEPVVEPLNYLGQDENYYYFEDRDGHLFKQTLQVNFTDSVDQAELRGSRFLLEDEAFKEIGFFNPEAIMYASIEIPTAEQEKQFDAEQVPFIPRIENVLTHWNF